MNIKSCCGCPDRKELIHCGCKCHKRQDIMSEVIEESKNFIIWYSEGDYLPYWVSGLDGTEIEAFQTLLEARHFVTTDIQKE
jgi:hypothetical protein